MNSNNSERLCLNEFCEEFNDDQDSYYSDEDMTLTNSDELYEQFSNKMHYLNSVGSEQQFSKMTTTEGEQSAQQLVDNSPDNYKEDSNTYMEVPMPPSSFQDIFFSCADWEEAIKAERE